MISPNVCSIIWATSWENRILAYAKTKAQISFAVTAKLISAFVFATRIVNFFFFLNPKFQVSNHLLWLYSPVCVGPGRKSRRPVFSRRGSYYIYMIANRQKLQFVILSLQWSQTLKSFIKAKKQKLVFFARMAFLVFLNRWKGSVAVLYFYFHMKPTFWKALTTPSNKKPFYTF